MQVGELLVVEALVVRTEEMTAGRLAAAEEEAAREPASVTSI
jgi:hypothetical protein